MPKPISGEKAKPVVQGYVAWESNKTLVELSGSWAFYPQKFVDPNMPVSQYDRFEAIDIPWAKYQSPLANYNYATYAVKITGLKPDDVYGLYFPEASSAIRVFLDGKQFYQAGVVGTSPQEEILDWENEVVALPAYGKTEVLLVIHMSNYHDMQSNFNAAIQIGEYAALLDRKNQAGIATAIAFGILLAMAAFFIALYFFYHKELGSLYFGLLCLSFAVRVASYDTFLLKTFFPSLSGLWLFKIGYLTMALGGIFTILFFYRIFMHHKRYPVFAAIPFAVYAVLILVTPTSVFVSVLLYVQLYMFLTAVMIVILSIRAWRHKVDAARLFLLGTVLFIILAVRDSLISYNLISGPFFSHFAILVLIFPMTIIVIKHFSVSFKEAERINTENERRNKAFKRFLPSEMMYFLKKKSIVDISLGDAVLEKLFFSFIHFSNTVGVKLKSKKERLALLHMYNDVLSGVNSIIREHKGFIHKHLSEGVMVLFYGTAEETLAGVFAVHEFLSHMQMFDDTGTEEKLQFSAAIDFGDAYIGTIGIPDQMDSVVISDTAAVSTRVAYYGWKKRMDVLITDSVKAQLEQKEEHTYSIRHRANIRVTKQDGAVKIYEVKKI